MPFTAATAADDELENNIHACSGIRDESSGHGIKYFVNGLKPTGSVSDSFGRFVERLQNITDLFCGIIVFSGALHPGDIFPLR